MRLLISGYGNNTAGLFDTNERRFVWESGILGISFMCVDTANNVLFGAGEYEQDGKVFMFTPEGSGWRLADTLEVPGTVLCHVSYSSKHCMLTGACYGNGDLFAAPVTENGFGPFSAYITQGAEEPAGTLSRAHCSVFDAGEDYLYAANIALDRVYCYAVTDGRLRECGCLQLDKGVGPRHIKALPGMLYVITEYSNEIIRVRLETPSKPVVWDRVSTLPDSFTGKSYGSAICGLREYLYAANRGSDTVAVFRLGPDGDLQKIADCPCAGKKPRHIDIVNLSGKPVRGDDGQIYTQPLMAVANESSGCVSLCPIRDDGLIGGEVLSIPCEGAAFVCEI